MNGAARHSAAPTTLDRKHWEFDMSTATGTAQSKSKTGGANAPADTSPDREDVSRQIEALKADIAALTETIMGLGRAEAEEAGRRVRAAGHDLKARGEATLTDLEAGARRYVRDGEEFVRTQPGTALGIAAAAGFLIGMMTSRR